MTRIIFVMTMALSGVALSGCARDMAAAFVYCQVEKPISWTKADTDQTIREVKAHNAVWKSLCK